MTFLSARAVLVRAAPKEKKMKRTIPLWLGLLAFALLPVLAQNAETHRGSDRQDSWPRDQSYAGSRIPPAP